jgi:hypothetical protein
MDSAELALQRAIAAISQSDPLIKLLEQVRLSRMKPTDAGLRAVTESWLATYRKAVETVGLNKQVLRRLDPTPRVVMLAQHGILSQDHESVKALLAGFEQAMVRAPE